MAIIDGNLLFEPIAGTAITVTAVSTNIIDLLNARDMGIGDDPALKVMVGVTAAFIAAGAATLNIQFQGAPDNGSGAPGTYTTYVETSPLSLASPAQLGINAQLATFDVPRTPPGVAQPRYLRLNYVVATGPFTAGAINAGIVLDRQGAIAYPPGITVAN